MEAIAIRLEAIAIRLEAIAIRLEAIAGYQKAYNIYHFKSALKAPSRRAAPFGSAAGRTRTAQKRTNARSTVVGRCRQRLTRKPRRRRQRRRTAVGKNSRACVVDGFKSQEVASRDSNMMEHVSFDLRPLSKRLDIGFETFAGSLENDNTLINKGQHRVYNRSIFFGRGDVSFQGPFCRKPRFLTSLWVLCGLLLVNHPILVITGVFLKHRIA